MLRYLLDTTICIEVINRRPHALLNTFNRYAGQMVISAITFSELHSPAPSGRLPLCGSPWNPLGAMASASPPS
jgi:tRNA(fMet)-specific endonuclease VapC